MPADTATQAPAPADAVGTVDPASLAHIDWDKMACLLCQRKFKSADQLTKHTQQSDLHKKNLQIHEFKVSRALDC